MRMSDCADKPLYDASNPQTTTEEKTEYNQAREMSSMLRQQVHKITESITIKNPVRVSYIVRSTPYVVRDHEIFT
jgi:hypothetical protein